LTENHHVTILCNFDNIAKLNSALFLFAADKHDLQYNLSQLKKKKKSMSLD